MKAQPPRARRVAADCPPLLNVLRDPKLYPLVRALLRNEISRLTTSMNLTFHYEGDDVVVHDDQLKTVAGSIGKAIGNPRLRVCAKRLPGLQGQITLVLSQPAKRALLVEMAALLANLSGTDVEGLPPIGARKAGETQ